MKIVNKYNYHYPGHYSIPVQNSYYPGYYYTPSSYHYMSSDTGSGALGFFLGYSLAKITTPTFSHQSFYDGYRPRYDHYTVHHYYHNRDSIPQTQEIAPNTIVGCVGDSSTVCPAQTTSLCTNTGALMCVVSATSTVPCTGNQQVNCVRSEVPCVNNSAPECKESGKNSTVVSIPCVSTAKIYGELTVVNNTIVVNSTSLMPNATMHSNSTSNNATTVPVVSDGVTTPKYSTYYPIVINESTQYPITTTPNPTQYPITTTPQPNRVKREVTQNFCVTIVALPAERKITEGEMVFQGAKDLTSKFLAKAFGL